MSVKLLSPERLAELKAGQWVAPDFNVLLAIAQWAHAMHDVGERLNCDVSGGVGAVAWPPGIALIEELRALLTQVEAPRG